MKTKGLIAIILLLSAHFITAQNDTLTGVLRDTKEKAIKRYEVRLGNNPGVTVKTDRNGVFVFPEANLQDTIYVEMNKKGKTAKVPVSGYSFLT
ncbi:MAG: TonB-dependent receptor, partial [Tannerellaceae bacterium]|nr:TonB-dependent receptor [Tannerellaceae bacterium]